MFGRKIEKAFSDWPINKVNAQKGYVEITGTYVTPAQQGMIVLIVVIAFVPLAAATGGAGLALLVPGVPALWILMKKNLRVRIDEETIRVRGKRYERNPDFVQFRVDWHHRAHEGGVWSDALEVVMQYGERRVPVAAMRLKDRQMAEALAFRLQAWCQGFEKIMASYQKPGAMPVSPESVAEEFGPAPDVR